MRINWQQRIKNVSTFGFVKIILNICQDCYHFQYKILIYTHQVCSKLWILWNLKMVGDNEKKIESLNPSQTRTNLIQMAEFLLKLHGCLSSSAEIETIFITVGHIWSKLRNKLLAGKVQKLVKIYRFYTYKHS